MNNTQFKFKLSLYNVFMPFALCALISSTCTVYNLFNVFEWHISKQGTPVLIDWGAMCTCVLSYGFMTITIFFINVITQVEKMKNN